MKVALPRYTYLNPSFVIDICKLNVEEKCKLQEDLFGVGACWNNGQRVVIEEGTDDSVGYTFDRIVDKDIALNLLRYRIFLK